MTTKTFTTREIAYLFKVSERTVRRWITKGKLYGYRSRKTYGRYARLLVSRKSLLTFLSQRFNKNKITYTEYLDIYKHVQDFSGYF